MARGIVNTVGAGLLAAYLGIASGFNPASAEEPSREAPAENLSEIVARVSLDAHGIGRDKRYDFCFPFYIARGNIRLTNPQRASIDRVDYSLCFRQGGESVCLEEGSTEYSIMDDAPSPRRITTPFKLSYQSLSTPIQFPSGRRIPIRDTAAYLIDVPFDQRYEIPLPSIGDYKCKNKCPPKKPRKDRPQVIGCSVW